MKLLKHVCFVCLLFFPLIIQGQTVIEMEQDGGVYKVPCKVNGLKLKFIFDTGASSVSISSTVADMMLENDYLSKEDILGNGYSQIADGRIVDHTRINLKSIEIGGMTLRNVEAVVIHQQSAPLLLGQSAIQKLGKVSISGNKLTITSYGMTNPYLQKTSSYSTEEIYKIYEEAEDYFKNENYLLAAEKYDIVFKSGKLLLYDLLDYAQCLGSGRVNRSEDALEVLLINEEDVIRGDYASKSLYYYEICKQAYFSKEYNLAIKYGELTKNEIRDPSQDRWYASYWIASSYNKLGDTFQAKHEIQARIDEYLNFMEISATDCWDKEYRDSLLGDMYYTLALYSGSTYLDGKKYYLISAAWGCNDAIEFCKESNWSYSNKPYDYVY